MNQLEIEKYWAQGLSYADFRALMHDLHAKEMVTGTNQSADLLAYSILNEQRMNRIDKHGVIAEVVPSTEIKRILVITEGWCGDSAQILPYMHKWALSNGHVIRIVLRDENLDLMDQFLTNGARAVPMFLFINLEGVVEEQWGARPKVLQDAVAQWKSEGLTKETFITMIHKWYADDRGVTFIEEWVRLSSAN
jgi:hypothetical protein